MPGNDSVEDATKRGARSLRGSATPLPRLSLLLVLNQLLNIQS
jgi:hypothetical protein